MKHLFSICATVGLLVLGAPGLARAQQTPPAGPPPPLRIFLDCYECDTDYLRREIVFIDYMRDRTDADLHVLVTTQSTGGGGTSWTVKFIGLGRFQGEDRTQTFRTSSTATSDDMRKEFARVFRLGLAGYAADTAVARDLDVTYKTPATTPTGKFIGPKKDPWNLWVYRVNGNVNVSGEQLSNYKSYRISSSATRVTEKFKMNFNANDSVNRSTYTLSDGRKVVSKSDNWGVNGSLVKSLGPKLSIGARAGVSHSSFSNSDRAMYVYPGIEYDFFPYADYERRSFTIWYEIGPNVYDYRELTIFDKLKEWVPKQQVDVSLNLRQPWGSLGIFGSVSEHLNHPGRYSASVFGNTDVRLFKGFSFNVFAQYSKIKDQISLTKAGASQDEILLRLQQLSTSYSYFFSFGFSYSFGSIFNSVVNPRFNGQNFFYF